MAALERLMGLGMAPELAKRVGFFVQTIGANTTINGPGNFMIETSATVNLGSGFDIGDMVIVGAITTVTINPDSSSRFAVKATASGAVVSAGFSRIFVRQSQTQWWVVNTTA